MTRKSLNISLSRREFLVLESHCRQSARSQSDVVRDCILHYLGEQGSSSKSPSRDELLRQVCQLQHQLQTLQQERDQLLQQLNLEPKSSSVATDDQNAQPVEMRSHSSQLQPRTPQTNAQQQDRLLDALPTPVLISRIETGDILYANSALGKTIGLTCADLLNRKSLDFYSNPADRMQILELLSQQGYVQGYELQVQKANDELAWLDLYIQPLELNGEPVLLSVVLDITEKKQVEQSLYQQEEHNRAVLEAIPDLLVRVRRDGTCLNVIHPQSNQAGRFLPLESHLSEVLPPSLLQQQMDYIHYALTSRQMQIYEHQLDKYGQRVFEEVRVVPVTEDEALLMVRDITEQKQAEEERDRFFDLSIDMFCIAGFDGYFQRLNPAWEKTLGYPRAELLANPYLSFVHPDDIAKTIGEAQQIAEGANTLEFENRYRCKDGSYRWLLWNSIPLIDQGVIYCVVHDITERKLVEENLRHSEATKQAMIAAVPDLMIRVHQDGTYLDIYGQRNFPIHAPENLQVGGHIYDALPLDLAQRCLKLIQRAIQTQVIQQYDQTIAVNGELRYEEVRIVALNEDEALVTVRDMTSRRQAEIALKQAERSYRSIFENAFSGIFQSTADGRYLRVNRAMASLHGYESPQQMLAEVQSIAQQIYVDPAIRQQFTQQLEAQGEVLGFQYQAYRRDGIKIWLEENARAVCDINGNLLYYEGSVVDITQRKQDEEALKQQLQKLQVEVDLQKRDRDVADIVNTDFFQALQSEIEELRRDDAP
ncbi:MAG: PAS domain S-box protein [Thainema sp.]